MKNVYEIIELILPMQVVLRLQNQPKQKLIHLFDLSTFKFSNVLAYAFCRNDTLHKIAMHQERHFQKTHTIIPIIFTTNKLIHRT